MKRLNYPQLLECLWNKFGGGQRRWEGADLVEHDCWNGEVEQRYKGAIVVLETEELTSTDNTPE